MPTDGLSTLEPPILPEDGEEKITFILHTQVSVANLIVSASMSLSTSRTFTVTRKLSRKPGTFTGS